jgi:hypothetical protein
MRKQSNIFPHRKNQDGSWDAICTTCFATAATSSHEAALAQEEATHICSHLTQPEIINTHKTYLHPRWLIDSRLDNGQT